jgi:hypothetical protein
VTPEPTVIDPNAKIFPTNVLLTPSDTVFGICQKTLQGSTPFNRIFEFAALSMVPGDPAWKMKTAFVLFPEFSVNVPPIVNPADPQ